MLYKYYRTCLIPLIYFDLTHTPRKDCTAKMQNDGMVIILLAIIQTVIMYRISAMTTLSFCLLWHKASCLQPCTICATSQQNAHTASVVHLVGWLINVPATCQRIYSDNFMCCHTEIEVADQTFYLTQYTDIGPTSPSTDPIMPGVWQGIHWRVNF